MRNLFREMNTHIILNHLQVMCSTLYKAFQIILKSTAFHFFVSLGTCIKFLSSTVLKVQSMVVRGSWDPFWRLSNYLHNTKTLFVFSLSCVYNGIEHTFKKIILFSKTNKISEKSSIQMFANLYCLASFFCSDLSFGV